MAWPAGSPTFTAGWNMVCPRINHPQCPCARKKLTILYHRRIRKDHPYPLMICETQCVASKRHAWLPRMAKTPRTHCFFMILTWFIIIFSSYCQNIVTIFSEVGHIDFHNLPSLIYIYTPSNFLNVFFIFHIVPWCSGRIFGPGVRRSGELFT